MMTGYKVTANFGRRLDCCSGYFRSREDAEAFCKWLGKDYEPRIFEKKKKVIKNWINKDPNWYK